MGFKQSEGGMGIHGDGPLDLGDRKPLGTIKEEKCFDLGKISLKWRGLPLVFCL